MKRRKVLIILVVFMLLFTACSSNTVETDIETKSVSESLYPLTIVDSYNREITIDEEPMRIISMAPSITETVYYIDASDKLVGRSEYCDFPEQVLDIDTAGTLREPNIEKITELNPDLVIGSTHFPKEAVETLDSLGIKVVVFVPHENFEGVYDMISAVGQVLNKEKEANDQITYMKEKVETVISKVKELSKKTVYYVVGFGEYGDYTAGGDTYINDLIEMAGGENIAKDISGWGYSLEKIIENDPEVMIISKYYGMKDMMITSEGYKELSAIKNEKLIEIDNNMIDRQGPRLADGLLELAKAIHGEDF